MSQGDVRAMSRGDVKLAMSGRSKLVMSRCVETVSPNLHLNSTGSERFPEAVRLGVVNSLGLPGSPWEMISTVSWESAAQLSLIEGVGLDDS